MATVCQTCGGQSFANALIYCEFCNTEAVHRYCLGITPVPILDYVTWFCEDCDGSDSDSVLEVGNSSGVLDPNSCTRKKRKLSSVEKERKKKKSTKQLAVEDNGLDDGDAAATNVEPLKDIEPFQPMKFFFNHTKYKKVSKIQTMCDIDKTLGIIERILSNDENRWFIDHPQFRHIFHMYRHSNRKLMGMWMLLLRTVKTDKKHECWFVVNGIPIRYSMREHALISGLDCKEFPKNHENSLGSFRFVERCFRRKDKIDVKDVQTKLESMPASRDRLKMAVLFFLSTIIKGKLEAVKGYIDPFLLRVVDDLDVCRIFPWGRFTFLECIKEIHHLMNHFKGNVRATCPFPGFILPLEVLAFECIPQLMNTFRENVENAEDDCPKMCKRKFKSTSPNGFRLNEIYEVVGTTKEIDSVLEPKLNEEPLLARIMGEKLYDVVDPIVDSWNELLCVQKKSIWWEDLYNLDVKSRPRSSR